MEHLHLFFILLTIGLTTVGVSILFFASLALYIVRTLIHPKKRTSFVPLTPFTLGLPAEEVQFAPVVGNHQVSGLFIAHPKATTTIIVCPGYRRTYTDVLGMCKHLWLAEHNVLAFEYYGHGITTNMPITLGYREMNDFLGAVEYAKQRAPQTRIGALGYSMGAAVSLMGAARTNEVEAVVADSAFASHWSAVEMAVHRTLHVSTYFPAWILQILYWLTDQFLWMCAGYHLHQVEPVRDIAQITPRPVLLIHGLKDTIVSPNDAHRLYQAAQKPKALWLLPETEHVKAYFSDSALYVARVTEFFDHHLKTIQQSRPQPLSPEAPPPVASDEPSQHTHCPQPLLDVQRQREEARTRPTVPSLGAAYGRFIYRFRWLVIALWFGLIVVSLPFAANISKELHNSGYALSSSESSSVDTQLVSTLRQPATHILAVFQSKTVDTTKPAYQREIQDFIARAKGFPHVTNITQGGIGRDGRSIFVSIGLNQDKDAVAENIPDFRQILPQVGPARAYLTGDAAAASEVQLDTQSGTEFAEAIAMPLTLLFLFVVFGSLVAGAMPLLMAGVTIPTALAAIYAIALHVNTNIFVESIVSIIGLGLSIDYSLFVVRRFREELAQGHGVQEAVIATVTTAGEAILFSGCTVAIGFTGLLFIGVDVMTSFGVGGILIAGTSVVSALTLLPALLSLVGTRVNALRLPLLSRVGQKLSANDSANVRPSFWRTFALMVMRKPILIVIFVSSVLLLLGFPARTLNPGDPGATSLPPSSEARVGLDILHTQFPRINDDPVYVLVRTQNGSNMLTVPNISRIDHLSRWLATQPHVTDVQSLTRIPQVSDTALGIGELTHLYSTGTYQQNAGLLALVRSTTQGDTTLIVLKVDTKAGTSADITLIDHLRSSDPSAKDGLITQIGGARVVNLDFNRTLYANFIRTLVFILLATYFLLLITFRSVLLPLKAIMMNAISISASYGSLVFVFQEGHFQQVLGFVADGTVDRFIPILLFCVLFGLSMDYEVFLLTRVREEWRRTQDNHASVALGLEKTGGTITNAALLFVIVSSAFIATPLIVTKELGLGITISVLVDASIIRCMLVPASMQLMGRWNWWFPKHVFRHQTFYQANTRYESVPAFHNRVGTSETVVTQALRSGDEKEREENVNQQAVTEQTLLEVFAHVLQLPSEQVQASSNFFQLGGDSDSLNALLSISEHYFQVQLTSSDIFDNPVTSRLATTITRKQQRVIHARREMTHA